MDDNKEKMLNELNKLKQIADPLLLVIEYYNAIKALKQAENLIATLKDGDYDKGVHRSMNNLVNKLENKVNLIRTRKDFSEEELEKFVEDLLSKEKEKGNIQKPEVKVDESKEFLDHLVGIKSYVDGLKAREPGFIYDNYSEYEELKKRFDSLENPNQEITDIMSMLGSEIELAKERQNNPSRSEEEAEKYQGKLNNLLNKEKVSEKVETPKEELSKGLDEGKRLTTDYKHDLYEMVKVPVVGAKKSLNRLGWLKAYDKFIKEKLAKKKKPEVSSKQSKEETKEKTPSADSHENGNVKVEKVGANEAILHPKDGKKLMKNIKKEQGEGTKVIKDFFESLRQGFYHVSGGPDVGDEEKTKKFFEEAKAANEELNPINDKDVSSNEKAEEVQSHSEPTEAEKTIDDDIKIDPEVTGVGPTIEAAKIQEFEKNNKQIKEMKKQMEAMQKNLDELSNKQIKIISDVKETLKIVKENKIDEKKVDDKIDMLRNELFEEKHALDMDGNSLGGRQKTLTNKNNS